LSQLILFFAFLFISIIVIEQSFLLAPNKKMCYKITPNSIQPHTKKGKKNNNKKGKEARKKGKGGGGRSKEE
jgi:hypothetical protein